MTTPFPFVAAQVLTANELNSITNLPSSTKTANYVLTVANAGARVVMNASGSTTITANTSIFSANDIVELSNIGAGVCTVTAGTATVSSAGPLAIPQYGGGRLVFTSASAAIYFPSAVTVAAPAAAGLTLISSTNASGNSFTISNCFSATYDNYLIQLGNMTTAGSPGKFRMRFGSGTAHAFNLNYLTPTGGAWTTDTAATSGNFVNLDAGYTTKGGPINVNSPFLTSPTTYSSLNQTPTELNLSLGIETSSTSFTDVTFSNQNAVSFTGGTVRIYGYANS